MTLGIDLHVVEQKSLVADARQLVLLLVVGQARHVVDLRVLQARDVFLRRRRERRLRQPLRPRRAARGPAAATATAARRANHQPVGAKRFLVEEIRLLQTLKRIAVPRATRRRRERRHIDPDRLHQPQRLGAVREWRRDAGGPAVGDEQASARAELVPLGMSAEVVVVVENEDLRRRARPRAVEVRRRQSADAAAHHDEIVGFARVLRRAGVAPEITVAQRMRHVERSVVAAAHAGQRRRIVTGRVLRKRRGLRHRTRTGQDQNRPAPHLRQMRRRSGSRAW